MKQIRLLILGASLLLSLTACGAPAPSPSAAGSDAPEASAQSSAAVTPAAVYAFGDSVTTEDGYFTFTPVFEGFAEELANWPDENYLTPEGQSVGSNPFQAEDEKIMMWFSGTVEYIGDSTTDETFSYGFQVIYDTDYVFDYDPYDCGYSLEPDSSEWETGDGNTMVFEPLSAKKTRYLRFCIEVPEQLASDSGADLSVVFTIEGTEYSYQIR